MKGGLEIEGLGNEQESYWGTGLDQGKKMWEAHTVILRELAPFSSKNNKKYNNKPA